MITSTRPTSGHKIKKQRLFNKLSVEDLTIKTGLSINELFALEHNEIKSQDKKIIDKLCKAFDCRDTDILEG